MNYWPTVIILFAVALVTLIFLRKLKILTDFIISSISTGMITLFLIIYICFLVANKVYPLMEQWGTDNKSFLDLLIYILNHNSTYLYAATFAGLASLLYTMQTTWTKLKRRDTIRKRTLYRKRRTRLEEDYRLRLKVIEIQRSTIDSLLKELSK